MNNNHQPLISALSVILEAKYDIIADIVNKSGIDSLLQHPAISKKLSKPQQIRLKYLAQFIRDYSTACFLNETTLVDSSAKARELCLSTLQNCQIEKFIVLFLNSQNELISLETLFEGTVNESAIYPRELIKRALELDTVAVIIAHNHPGGSMKPSPSDIAATNNIKTALQAVQVKLIDHIIVGHHDTYSFAEKGLI